MPRTRAYESHPRVEEDNALGIDRKHLLELRRRFLHVNQQRLERTRSGLHDRQGLILDLLPLLFHVNHPLLPGYTSLAAPCGLAGYKPDKSLLRQARRLARSFRYQPLRSGHQAILGIYIMGSVGTIGQTRGSDLDIWICHTGELQANAVAELQRKCQRITDWCLQANLEVCFFTMDSEKFCQGETVPLSEESSGSAQHGLLLDEFYRSAIYLGGRYPLWWFVPEAEEQRYDVYGRELLQKRFLRNSEIIDLGMPRVPAGEYVTAAIWQLYKGIHSPYKSVLKLMLLESYAARYPQTQLLSSLFKSRVHQGCTDINRLDPYRLTYEAIAKHLNRQGGARRLELVRRCFYIKVDKPLSKQPEASPASWQRDELEALVSSWGWDKQQLQHLDRRRHWKTATVARERLKLVRELLQSYRLLSGFVRSSKVSLASIQEEISLLGRKLFAAFERRAGKIDWINPDISPDLSETYLTVRQRGRGVNGEWLLLDQPPLAPGEDQRTSPLRRAGSPLELVVWAYCNEILADQTHAWLQTSDRQTYKLSSLHAALKQWLPLPVRSAEHSAFSSKPCALSLLLVINLGEPPRQLSLGNELELDPLNVGKDKVSLVNDAHLVVRNSWNEVLVQSFAQSGLESLVTGYLQLAPPHLEGQAPQLSVFCREGNLAMQMKNRLTQLVAQLRDIFYCCATGPPPSFVLCHNGRFSCWEIHDQLPVCRQLGDEEQLLRYLSQPRPTLRRFCFDQHTLPCHPLAALVQLPASAAIQVAYHTLDRGAELLILDEKGSLFQSRTAFHNEATLLRPLHLFLRHLIERQNLVANEARFIGVYPVEFFRLQRDETTRRFRAERLSVARELGGLEFFNIHVSVEVDTYEQLHYAICCGEREFHEAEYGPRLFRQAAAFILSHRANRERYPCYITDLDLSQCSHHIAGDQPLQSIHYLRIKHEIERRLNLELVNL